MIGALCYGVGTFLTLRSGMSGFESSCYSIDSLVDQFIDINTVSPVFLNDELYDLTLRSKSERTLFYAMENIVFRLCDEFCKDYNIDISGFSRDGLKRAMIRKDHTYCKIVECVFTHVFNIGIGFTTAFQGSELAVHAWMQDRIQLEDRVTIQSAMVLLDNLEKDGRLK